MIRWIFGLLSLLFVLSQAACVATLTTTLSIETAGAKVMAPVEPAADVVG